MNSQKFTSIQANQANQSTHNVISVPQPTVEPPSAWIQQGTSPTEIILAISILITAIGGGLISSIAFLVYILIPVMTQKTPPNGK